MAREFASKRCKTPLGEFNSVSEAARAHGISRDEAHDRFLYVDERYNAWIHYRKGKVVRKSKGRDPMRTPKSLSESDLSEYLESFSIRKIVLRVRADNFKVSCSD